MVAGVIGVTGAWGAAIVGCNSNGTSEADSGIADATADAQVDAKVDVLVEGQADTGQGSDADAATNPDADAEAALTDGDAGLSEAVDASAALAFPAQVAAALCDRIAACCGTSLDAATFNSALCISDELPGGFKGSSGGSDLIDAGNILFNATAAAGCLSAIGQIDCATNQISSSVETQLYQNCLGAYVGTLAVGSPCRNSIECAANEVCLPVDGGIGDAGAIGLCQPLAGQGGACGPLGQSMCSYRASGNTGLFCQEFATGAPDAALDAGSWTCEPQGALGAACAFNLDCTSFQCPGSLQCVAVEGVVTPSTCAPFAVIDAGGD
jgi:hypothetical protein